MKRQQMISVIVATYNQELTIARTLDAILSQRCHLPIEILVGDDCSTDHTGDICQKYAQRYPDRIRLFRNPVNKGLIDNYYDLLCECRGTLIADCAGDDFWIDPQKLEKQSLLMERYPDVTLVHTAWQYYDNISHTTWPSPRPSCDAPLTDGLQLLEPILTQMQMPVVHLCTALYRADVIMEEYNRHTAFFRNPEWGCEDVPITFMLARRGRIAYLPDVTLCYSQDPTTISGTTDEHRQFLFKLRTTRLSHHLAETYHIRTSRTKHYFECRLTALLMHAFRCHDTSLRDTAERCATEWHTGWSLRNKLIRFILHSDALWRCGLKLRENIR